MAAYGYVRVSTSRQAEQGESLAVQQRKVKGYALQHDWGEPILISDDAVSGSVYLSNRPQGGELIKRLKSGDVLIASKLDRLFRSALDALTTVKHFEQEGIKLHLLDMGGDVTGTGVARLFFTMVSAFAEFERERIAERIREVKQDQKRRGRFLGGSRPIGWNVTPSGQLSIRKSESRLLPLIRQYHSQGLSLRKIAGQMKSHGLDIHYSTVRKILANTDASL